MKLEKRQSGGWAAATVVAAILLAFAFLAAPSGAQGAPTCNGVQATIIGTNGDDFLVGTDQVDVIVGLAGADTIYGRENNDIICGGPGPDFILAGKGHDHVWGNGGNDRIKGDLGHDVLSGGNGQDVLVGQAGFDELYGESGRDRLLGGRGTDVLRGGVDDDRLFGNNGPDLVYGDEDSDYCEPDDLDELRESCETPQVAAPSLTELYELESLSIINDERASRNLPLLGRHPDLDSYARAWSAEMASIGLPLQHQTHHSPPFTGSSYPFQNLPTSVQWVTAFENVGYATTSPQETPAEVMQRLFYAPNGYGFMSSAGHKCNIIETAVVEVGLGAFVDSSGAVWVAQVYWGTEWPVPDPVVECESIVGR
jgi:uncharacterized protein YkwD